MQVHNYNSHKHMYNTEFRVQSSKVLALNNGTHTTHAKTETQMSSRLQGETGETSTKLSPTNTKEATHPTMTHGIRP